MSGGDKDAIPLSATRELYDLIRSSGVPASLYVYRNGSHRWPGLQGTAGIDAGFATPIVTVAPPPPSAPAGVEYLGNGVSPRRAGSATFRTV